MSKEIEELIIVIEDQLSNFEGCGMVIIKKSSVESAIDKLRILAKPVQYVVEFGYENSFVEIMFYRLNGICICVNVANHNATKHEQDKINCLKVINESVVLIGLPPITIDQITFVEV